MDWSWVEQHRKLNFMRKYMPKEFANLNPATVADSEKNYQAVKARFEVPNKKSLRQSWCKLNLRERAIKADFEEMYSAVYGSVVRIAFIPSALLIGFWFLTQLFCAGAVAYLAHIGGFLFGVVTARIFEGFRPIAELET